MCYHLFTWRYSMYEVEFYRDKNGKSEIVDYLDDLKVRGSTSKKRAYQP